MQFSAEENEFILAIKTLQDKHVITECDHEGDKFISPIFLVPKDGDSFRLILNLRKLNQSMPYMHFKMDTADKVIKLVRQNCFMCTVDIKDAYYSVGISESCQKYLKFKYQDKLFKFLALPNGLCSGPRKFTKLSKPALAFLRKRGFIVSAYIDDITIIDESYDACINGTVETIKLLDFLGFVIHPKKYNFVPFLCVTYLGFTINSETMNVTFTHQPKY